MPKIINMLTDLKTGEVSLVRRGANNKRIALTKSESEMNLEELIKSVLETEAEGEKDLVKSLEARGLKGDALEIAKSNYRMQQGFKDLVTSEELAEVAKAAGVVVKAKDEKQEKSYSC